MRSGEIERQFPELRELVTFSAAWYWVFACAHIAEYSRLDRRSCDNLFLEIKATQSREDACHES